MYYLFLSDFNECLEDTKMYNIKTYNKISAIGLDEFDKTAYTCGDDVVAPRSFTFRVAFRSVS